MVASRFSHVFSPILAAMTLWSCGVSTPREPQLVPSEEEAITAVISVCGAVCPAGYYVTQSRSDTSCAAQGGVSSMCSNVLGPSIRVCGAECPAGYYVTQSQPDSSCPAQGRVSSSCSM